MSGKEGRTEGSGIQHHCNSEERAGGHVTGTCGLSPSRATFANSLVLVEAAWGG
eukprot:CAMPEP_0196589208 /NCGR_PEP_ID=MMETSP1081-20130531/62991_1 /TAXON_ID=36882 /ORGANISM="Pyramimonas amylifera, Strain CCMP720" /LENGTH=53 /DNA_ID=CAMNT_0041911941 /DNA_START=647 /DNA_END=808 /DNA_ORIENTATION=+